MSRNNQVSLTDKNLDHQFEFLNRELHQSTLPAQMPEGAHLFYGSYNDPALTQDNLRLVSKTLFGMTPGYVEEAPLVMMFESQNGKQRVISLSDEMDKTKIRSLIEKFQQQIQHEMIAKINELEPA